MGAPPLRTERASNLMPKGRARDGGGIEPPDRRPPQSANPPRRRFPPSTYRPAVAGGILLASSAACGPSRSPQDAFSGLGDSPYLHPADSAVPAIHSLAVRGRSVCRTSTDLTARRLLVWCPRLESNQRVRLRRSPPYPLGHGGIRFVSSGRVYGPPGSGHPRRACPLSSLHGRRGHGRSERRWAGIAPPPRRYAYLVPARSSFVRAAERLISPVRRPCYHTS